LTPKRLDSIQKYHEGTCRAYRDNFKTYEPCIAEEAIRCHEVNAGKHHRSVGHTNPHQTELVELLPVQRAVVSLEAGIYPQIRDQNQAELIRHPVTDSMAEVSVALVI